MARTKRTGRASSLSRTVKKRFDPDEAMPIYKRKIAIESTDAPPGSKEKIDVMTERASRGEWIFHPADARDKD